MSQQAGATLDRGDFIRSAEPYRRELTAHCYRMLGSVDDAEDLVQDTYLRAWRSLDRFEGRSSLRTWLYQIASNACLTALERRSRRPLPSGLGSPAEYASAPPATGDSDVPWLQPIPDSLVWPEQEDPAAIAVSRESLRLALVASFQFLPPRQRAVLLLRDVLAFPASEVASMLGMSTPAIKSALQRARARLEEVTPAADAISEPEEPQARAVLDAYIRAFETSDAVALKQLLRRDATLELRPSAAWFTGAHAIAEAVRGLGSPGDWRMLAVAANGQPAAAAYHRQPDGSYRAYGIVVLTATVTGIARLVVFADPGVFRWFDLPQTYSFAQRDQPAREHDAHASEGTQTRPAGHASVESPDG